MIIENVKMNVLSRCCKNFKNCGSDGCPFCRAKNRGCMFLYWQKGFTGNTTPFYKVIEQDRDVKSTPISDYIETHRNILKEVQKK